MRGVYYQDPVTSTAATTRHQNGTPMLGIPVAGHLKGFYKIKIDLEENGSEPDVKIV